MVLGLGDRAGGGEGGGVGRGGGQWMKSTSWRARKIMTLYQLRTKCLLLWPISIVGGAFEQKGGKKKKLMT